VVNFGFAHCGKFPSLVWIFEFLQIEDLAAPSSSRLPVGHLFPSSLVSLSLGTKDQFLLRFEFLLETSQEVEVERVHHHSIEGSQPEKIDRARQHEPAFPARDHAGAFKLQNTGYLPLAEPPDSAILLEEIGNPFFEIPLYRTRILGHKFG
jgi:hypothetical protein